MVWREGDSHTSLTYCVNECLLTGVFPPRVHSHRVVPTWTSSEDAVTLWSSDLTSASPLLTHVPGHCKDIPGFYMPSVLAFPSSLIFRIYGHPLTCSVALNPRVPSRLYMCGSRGVRCVRFRMPRAQNVPE